MIYGSVCSGIEAASAAWGVLGWRAAFFSEIEAFPSAVLAHHHPSVPNHGDMTRFAEWPDHAIDLLVGGTPCQSFSVAGLRAGLADPRGNLMLTYLAVAARYRPRWLVWENVPGVLSSGGGRDFGSLLGGLGQLGYGFAYRVLDAQFCRALGLAGAVPQRRRRVFVVGYLGDWRRAAAVLFDAASLRGDHPPCRQAGQGAAPTISARPTGGGGLGTDFDLDGGLIENLRWPAQVAPTLNAHFGDKMGLEDQHALGGGGLFVPAATNALTNNNGQRNEVSEMVHSLIAVPTVAASLTRGAESAGKGGYAGRRQEDDANLIAFDTTQITSKANRSVPKPGDPSHPLAAGAHPPAIAHEVHPINTMVGLRHEALGERTGLGIGDDGDPAFTLSKAHAHAVQQGWAVRRLTPTECERLQGFEDGYTAITHRGKPAADGPRYKALGNSMAVNCMRVLGARIQMVEALPAATKLQRAAE